MKAKNIFRSAMMVFVAGSISTSFISCSSDQEDDDKQQSQTSNKHNGHEYVDLGLPSGTLWATCNIGAESPEDYGHYFAWGEVKPKDVFDWDTYKYGKCLTDIDDNPYEGSLTKYSEDSKFGAVDNKTELALEDDAAYVNWGEGWRMPSIDQIEELIDDRYTTTTWEKVNGVYGRKVTSDLNGKSLFLPAAGYRGWLNGDGPYGLFWSRSLSNGSYNAYYLNHNEYDIYVFSVYRYRGLSVRPVYQK